MTQVYLRPGPFLAIGLFTEEIEMAANIRNLVGGGLGQLISREEGMRRLYAITVEGDGDSWAEAWLDFASIEGLAQVRSHFNDDRTAFEWLKTANIFTGGVPPVERLRQGAIDEVVRAAEGALDYQ